MKSACQRNRKGDKPLSKRMPDINCSGAKKSAKRTGGWNYKSAGQAEEVLPDKDKKAPLSSMAEGRDPDPPVKSTCVSEETKRSHLRELYPAPRILPSAKIKLQLFPIDEDTRIGLEKDGHHPFLELTLSARKKISSVLNHLNSKWGVSSIALGELMVCPYNILKHASGYRRWTLNDKHISAGDVYVAVGSPAIFRLRYGWFCYSEPKTLRKISSLAPEDISQYDGTQKGGTNNMEVPCIQGKHIESSSEVTAAVVAEKVSNEPVDPVAIEPWTDAGPGQASFLWADNLTNISVGGLLSEASFQGKFKTREPITNGLTNTTVGPLSGASLEGKSSNCDPKSLVNTAGLKSTELISDSLDAYIAAQTICPEGPRLCAQESCSSILDGEETCHGFPFQNFPSLGKDVRPWEATNCTGDCGQDTGSKLFKVSNGAEINCQPGFSQDRASQESETNLLLCLRTINDESSLGLSGIKWTESLGPFDLGLPTSQKLTNGDSINIHGCVR